MTAKTLDDLTHECCELSCLAGGLVLLILNSGDGNDSAMVARDAAYPLAGILADRLSVLHNDLDRFNPAQHSLKGGAQ